jgi:hypothetical protein
LSDNGEEKKKEDENRRRRDSFLCFMEENTFLTPDMAKISEFLYSCLY